MLVKYVLFVSLLIYSFKITFTLPANDLPSIQNTIENEVGNDLTQKSGSPDYKLKYDVVIVGAGMAGLSAAQHLVRNGMKNVIVFEAKNRIGGRIYTKRLPTGPIDFGAQWIHGGNIVNNVFNLANLQHILSNETCDMYEGPFITRNGTLVDEQLVNRVVNDFKPLQNCDPKLETLEECVNQNFKKILVNYSNEDKQIVKEMFNVYKVKQTYEMGHELNSTAAVNDYVTIPCDLDVIDGTDRLLQSFIREIGERVYLEHTVTNINWNHTTIVVSVKHQNMEFTVNTEYLISTVPLGYLKKHHLSLFTPNLPLRKVNAINNLNFGKGVKILLFYQNPFWRKGAFKVLKLGITDEMYLKGYNEFIYRIVEFSELNDNPNILVTVAFGNIAEEVELLENSVINRLLTQLLRNYTGDVTIPEADVVYKSNWINDEFTLGTYSLPGIKYENDFEILSEPLPETGVHHLFIAGEATSNRFFGTMHCARESGIRDANRILSTPQPN